jgi:hypothetical protein
MSRAAKELEGTVVVDTKSMFAPALHDAGFNFSLTAIKEIKDYLTQQGYPDIKRVFMFTAFGTNLKRTNTKMHTETQLYLVKDTSGEYNALYFAGCSIDESL